MVEEYYYDPAAYAAAGKPPPRHYDERTAGQVTVFSYAEPEVGVTYVEPVGAPPLVFDPRTLAPVVISGPPEMPAAEPVVADILGEVVEAGILPAGIIGLIPPVVAGLGLPDWLWTAATIGLAAYGIYEAMDGVNGGVNGGAAMTMVRNGGMVPVGGPGVPEPPAAMVAKQWKTKAFSKTAGEYWVYFFKLIDGRIMCYNGAKRSWKMWRPKKPIVLFRGKTNLSQAIKAQRMLDQLWKRIAKNTKALKMATAATKR